MSNCDADSQFLTILLPTRNTKCTSQILLSINGSNFKNLDLVIALYP